MKKSAVFIFLFFFVNSYAQVPGPRISAKNKIYSFGKIKEGDILMHDFVIFNSGDSLLQIYRIESSCGCTVAKLKNRNLKPNTSAIIHVEFNSEGKTGEQTKYVYIYSNDLKNREFKLELKGEVIPRFTKQAEELKQPKLLLGKSQYDFGTVKTGKVLDLTVKVKNIGKAVLKIKDIQTSCGCTAALLTKKTLKPGEVGKLKIEFDTSGYSGKITRTVTVYSNDPEEPLQTIVLFVNIKKRK